MEILAGYENGNEIYDLCADFAADVILEELTGMPRARRGDYFRGARIAAGYGKLQYKLKSRTFPAFVRYCAGSPEAAEGLRQLKRKMTSDNHAWWNAENHVLPQIQNYPGQNGDGKTKEGKAGKGGSRYVFTEHGCDKASDPAGQGGKSKWPEGPSL